MLRGGKLSGIIDNAFSSADDEQTAEDKFRLRDLEKELEFSVGITADAIKAKLSELEKIPATKRMVDEYRSRKERLAARDTAKADRMEVYNRLYGKRLAVCRLLDGNSLRQNPCPPCLSGPADRRFRQAVGSHLHHHPQ